MTIRIDGASLAYETVGSGRPLLCLHGYSIDRRMMKACMEPLFAGRAEGWQRIYVDLPGMGESRAPMDCASSDGLLAILLGFIDAVIPGQSFTLAGESYGGYLARGIVKKRSAALTGVLLLCPMIVPDREKRERPAFSLMARDEGFDDLVPARDLKKFKSDMVVQTRETWERYRQEILPGLAAGDRDFQAALHGPGYAFSFDVDVLDAPCGKPSLLLLGRQDDVVGYRDAWRIVENFPRATLAVLDRAGHNLQIEQAGLFGALAGEWLARVQEACP
jgi:pimeloyl-ACP methyl ester carboxylesterase